jgi:hypothetical protein
MPSYGTNGIADYADPEIFAQGQRFYENDAPQALVIRGYPTCIAESPVLENQIDLP